jgi:hypothetical protein
MNSIGLSTNLVKAVTPTVRGIRPGVKSMDEYMHEARNPVPTIVDIGYRTLPDYSINTYTPRIPTPNARIVYTPPRAVYPSTALPSSTALLMSKAEAIKSYKM